MSAAGFDMLTISCTSSAPQAKLVLGKKPVLRRAPSTVARAVRSPVQAMTTPTIFYFPVRARAEPLKIALSLKGVEYNFQQIDKPSAKDLSQYPFGQAPRYKDDSVDMVQTNSILRHIGRKFGLYGEGLQQQALVDQIIDGVEGLAGKTFGPVLLNKTDENLASYWETHGNPSSKQGQNGGAHLYYLDAILKKSPGQYAAGSSPTIADAALYYVLELISTGLADKMQESYPDLAAYQKHIAELPQLKKYFSSS